MRRIPPILLPVLVFVVAGCDDGSSNEDAGSDTALDTGTDVCSSHPGTCNLDDSNPLAPWECCPTGQQCCPLCHDADRCQFNYDCAATCPETLPCTGVLGSGGFSCHYEPADFTSTVYCPVPEGALTDTVVACSASCDTGVECPFDEATFGDAALCCPASASCGSGGFGLPFCN
jgi:hypothetical protein